MKTIAIARAALAAAALVAALPALAEAPLAPDLEGVKARGVLRHLGVPYANFNTGGGDGFDVELMQGFARHLGVKYEFVESTWPTVLPDLVGRQVSSKATDLAAAPPAPIKGDVVSTGLTVLPWREKVVAFSKPYFPTQVWVVARSDTPVAPIKPGATVQDDIVAVKALLAKRTLLGVASTCLDPSLYAIDKTGAKVQLAKLQLNEVAPLVMNGDTELALLDVADAMPALQKWPGKMKIIGPISEQQDMAVGFRKGDPKLREAFDAYLVQARRDGTYDRLVKKYFPDAPMYFKEFFALAK